MKRTENVAKHGARTDIMPASQQHFIRANHRFERTVALASRSAVLVIAALGACAESSDTGASSAAIVTADEANGKLVLRYSEGDRSITFDLRLGPKMETLPSDEAMAADPMLPSYEADARVLDQDGQPFHMQMAGDAYIDPTWQAPVIDNIDEEARDNDFRMLRESASAIRGLQVPAGVEQLRLNALAIAEGAEHSADKSEDDNQTSEREPRCELCVGGHAVVKWDFAIRIHPVLLFGQHSAVLLRGWSAATRIVYTAVSCNHGSCATASDMSTHCTMPGFKRDDGTHTRWFQAGGCTTRYQALSTGGGHNCNDDSELQARAIWFDRRQSTTGGNCSSLTPRISAPGCTF